MKHAVLVAHMAVSGKVAVADIVEFLIYIGARYQPLLVIIGAIAAYRIITGSLLRVTQVLDMPQFR